MCLQQSALSLFLVSLSLCLVFPLSSDLLVSRSHPVSGHATAKIPLITSCALTSNASRRHLSPHSRQYYLRPPPPVCLKRGNMTRYQQCDWGCVQLEVRINWAQGLALVVADVLQPRQPHELWPPLPSSVIVHHPVRDRAAFVCLWTDWPQLLFHS